MPKRKAGGEFYATATKAVRHRAPVIENGVAGVAVKQKNVPATAGIANRDLIAIGEAFLILHKGQVEVDTVAGFAKGDPVYIIPATNVLTETATSNAKYGVVVEVAGERGTPTGKVRIDLDAKDSF